MPSEVMLSAVGFGSKFFEDGRGSLSVFTVFGSLVSNVNQIKRRTSAEPKGRGSFLRCAELRAAPQCKRSHGAELTPRVTDSSMFRIPTQ